MITSSMSGDRIRTHFAGCLGTSVGLVFICALLFWLPQLYNNWQLKHFADNLYDYPLPPKTQVLEQFAEVGLTGNGNHCDFAAQQIMKTELSWQEINQYYQSVMLPPVNNHNEGKAPEFRDSPIPVVVTLIDEDISSGWLQFKLSIFDFGHSAGLDIRCH